jgi:hypothetical protein
LKLFLYRPHDSIATILRAGRRGVGVRFPVGARYFSVLQKIWGTPILLYNGYRGVVHQGVKRQGHKTGHPLPSGADVKNCGALPPLPHTSLWRGG